MYDVFLVVVVVGGVLFFWIFDFAEGEVKMKIMLNFNVHEIRIDLVSKMVL